MEDSKEPIVSNSFMNREVQYRRGSSDASCTWLCVVILTHFVVLHELSFTKASNTCRSYTPFAYKALTKKLHNVGNVGGQPDAGKS